MSKKGLQDASGPLIAVITPASEAAPTRDKRARRTGTPRLAELPKNSDGTFDLSGLSKSELADLIWEEAEGKET